MKKLFAILMTALLCLALVGCSSNDAGSETGGDSTNEGALAGVKVGVLVVTTQSQWCNDIVEGVKAAVEPEGAEVIVSDSQVSIDNELSGMENLINAGCKAIVVNAMNAAGLADLAKTAREKGVYVIGWSEMLVNYDALVVEDYDKEAEIITSAIADYIDEKALTDVELAEIWLADSANPDTNAGLFKAAIEKAFENTLVNGKSVTIVNSQYAADTNAAMNNAEAILAANPNISIIFTQSDEFGVGVAQVISAKNLDADSIMVCGLDGSAEAMNAIASGSSSMKATVYVNTVGLGTLIGDSIVNYLTNGVASDVVTEYTLVTAANVNEVLGK